jgi:hypothetical protein
VKARADVVIAALALAVLVVLGIAIYGAQRAPASTPYASTSAASDGTLALYRWLATLGFHPVRLSSRPLRLEGLRALFVLEPQAAFSTGDVATTLQWVRQGGTLVLLEDGGDPALPNALHLSIRPLPGADELPFTSSPAPYGAAPVQPLLAHPPLRGLNVSVSAGVYGAGPGVVPVLGNGGMRAPDAAPHAHVAGPDARNPVLVYEQVDRGRVYAGSTPAAVANGLIAAGDNRRLALNLLAGLPRGARVGFDDFHLVTAASEPMTLGAALTTAGWGRALLYALALTFVYVVLTGRRLGRPLRAVPERGRSLAEYVISMAAIFRRAGLRSRVLALWQADLRRDLAGPGGVRGRTDADLVAEAMRRADLTPEEQDEALTLLRAREALGEGALVELCARIAHLQRQLSPRR